MSKKIADIRKQLGMTQRELAFHLGWNQPRIANYEMGIRVPALKDARKIVAKLNDLGADVTIDDVFPENKQ